jgi:hypothetical protein
MKPNKTVKPASDIFTAILALGTGIVIASAAFNAYTCFAYYEAIFKIVEAPRF